MFRVRRLLISLAVALVIANAQCVIQCAMMPCDTENGSQSADTANLPPCHQHHSPKHSDAPRPCAISFVPIGDRAPLADAFDQLHSMMFEASSPVGLAGLPSLRLIEITQVAAPPYATDFSSHSVLRI